MRPLRKLSGLISQTDSVADYRKGWIWHLTPLKNILKNSLIKKDDLLVLLVYLLKIVTDSQKYLTVFFFPFSGPIDLNPCAVACASTLQKTSTTSGTMSLAATSICSQYVRWYPVLSASSLAIPSLSRSTCCFFMANPPPMSNFQGMGLWPPIKEMRGISVGNVHFQTPLSLLWRSTSFSSIWAAQQNSILVTGYTVKVPQLQRFTAARCAGWTLEP